MVLSEELGLELRVAVGLQGPGGPEVLQGLGAAQGLQGVGGHQDDVWTDYRGMFARAVRDAKFDAITGYRGLQKLCIPGCDYLA